MSNFSKFLVAGLLTTAVIGGSATYLATSLNAKPVSYAVDGIAIEQPQHAAPATKVVTAPNAERAS